MCKDKKIKNLDKEFSLLKVGHCNHPEAMIMQGGSFKSIKFPAIVAVLQHPLKGVILFDTGYAKRFLNATKTFPECLYRWITPMHLCEKEQLPLQLKAMGIETSDVKHIFISHFHADHIAGLLDFSNAQFICSKEAYLAFTKLRGFSALIKGYLPELLPSNSSSRIHFIEDCNPVQLGTAMHPFHNAYDLFGDGFALAVPLPGHAHGHFGLLCHGQKKSQFLVADACWTEQAFTNAARPKRIASIIMNDFNAYLETLENISQLFSRNKEVNIIPSHCQQTYQRWLNE